VFGQIHRENQGQKAEKCLKSLQFSQKRNMCKVEAKEDMVAIAPLKRSHVLYTRTIAMMPQGSIRN
jgi:hypothetical protein